ncbi:MAG TPA: DUF374 domain-containing protein [bacterium]|nr:DUF374 domain-containing protein [bacterium]
MKFSPRIISFFGWLFVLFLGKTLRIEARGEENVKKLRKKGEEVIYTFWHGRMFLPTYHLRSQGIYALVSKHRDGEYLARILNHLGSRTIRGSTSHGGGRALLLMARKLKEGFDGAFAPDGPRGPIYKAKSGIIRLAQRTQIPIIPLSSNAYRKKVYLNNWSRFILPRFFSRGLIIYGEPITVPPKASQKIIKEKTEELEKALNRLTQEADNYF